MVHNCFTLGFQFMASEVTGRYERLVDLDVFLGETAEIQASKKREKEKRQTSVFNPLVHYSQCTVQVNSQKGF